MAPIKGAVLAMILVASAKSATRDLGAARDLTAGSAANGAIAATSDVHSIGRGAIDPFLWLRTAPSEAGLRASPSGHLRLDSVKFWFGLPSVAYVS